MCVSKICNKIKFIFLKFQLSACIGKYMAVESYNIGYVCDSFLCHREKLLILECWP